MFIDCHTHAFSDKIAEKAVNQLITYYKMPTDHGGRLGDLLRAACEAGLDAIMMLVAATKGEQVRPANDWVVNIARTPRSDLQALVGEGRLPRVVHFGTYHPEDPDWPREIAKLRAAGLKGIKLHPEFQSIDLADPRLDPFFEEVSPDFTIMIHMGDPSVSPDNFSTPAKLAAILDRFPKLRVIAAHMGGLFFWEEALELLAGRDVWFDTSSTLQFIDAGLYRKLFAKHGTERILFGSDYPLQSPREALRDFEAATDGWLTESEKDRILGANCAELLGIQ